MIKKIRTLLFVSFCFLFMNSNALAAESNADCAVIACLMADVMAVTGEGSGGAAEVGGECVAYTAPFYAIFVPGTQGGIDIVATIAAKAAYLAGMCPEMVGSVTESIIDSLGEIVI